MSWQDFLARHQVGDVIEGVVTDQVPFGSFVESEGVTGLAPGQSWPPAPASRSASSRWTQTRSGSAGPGVIKTQRCSGGNGLPRAAP